MILAQGSRLLVLTALCCVASAPALAAQRADADSGDWNLARVGGLHVGAPAAGSLAVGANLYRRDDAADRWFGVAEPGFGAGRASVGFLHLNTGLVPSWSLRVSALRTWHSVARIEPGHNFAGAEGQLLAAFGLGIRGGLFRRVGPRDRVDRAWLVSGDLSFGI